MNEKFRQNKNAGDGIGLERSTDDGETWEQVGYINTGANGSTARLARNAVAALNHIAKSRELVCPAALGFERYRGCSQEDDVDCEKCWEEALDNAE